MDDEIESRLESHAEAFEGLLSLIPADEYYGRDNSDQWQRKKQTKEEKKAARKAKLDPANRKSAMDVINENEKKRKREMGIDTEEVPAAQTPDTRDSKKPKTATPNTQDTPAGAKADKRREKRERQKAKQEKQKQKSEANKARKAERKSAEQQEDSGDDESEDESVLPAGDGIDSIVGLAPGDLTSAPAKARGAQTEDDAEDLEDASAPSSPVLPSTSAPQSAASSATSLNTATEDTNADTASVSTTASKKPKAFNLPKIDPEELQSRLKARIEELRARRKADGPTGQPVRSRQDLLESRRKKSEARKAHKKELRQKAKAEEERLNQERLQGSGSPLSADIFSPRSPMQQDNYFTFGRVAFEDGQLADTINGEAVDAKHRKGPKDPKVALELAKKREARLKGFDEDKRADIQERDRWLAAKMKVHGERVRDDSNLLKKALKRKEKSKAKSEKEWKDREEGVRHGKEMRQKKRDENLAKRKEEKGQKGKKGGKPKGKPKKKGRPGFEGK